MITDPFAILIIFLGVICLALALISKFRIAQKISPVILILFFSALLANTGVLPKGHDFYNQLSGYAVPFAVCLILLHVRLADIRKTGLPLLATFALASLGSVLGCLVSGLLLQDKLDALLGGEGWKLAGPYIGTYIGGSINFFAMWTGLKIENPNLFAAANAVDNLTLIPIFMFWVFCPRVLSKWFRQSQVNAAAIQSDSRAADQFKLEDVVKLILIAMTIMCLSDLARKYILARWMPDMPAILVVTTLSLIAAQFKSVTDLHGAKPLGNLAFYLFFAAIGAMMDIPKAVCLAPVLFFYVVVIILTQILIVLSIGRLFKMDLRLIAVASLAAKAGPQTVVAYTNTKNWNDLALPGAAAGILGYAVANFIAYAGAHLLRVLVN